MKRSFETSLHVSRRTYFWQLYVSQDSTNGSPADIEAGDDLGFADIGAAEFSESGRTCAAVGGRPSFVSLRRASKKAGGCVHAQDLVFELGKH
jgi:hypothetical protein